MFQNNIKITQLTKYPVFDQQFKKMLTKNSIKVN